MSPLGLGDLDPRLKKDEEEPAQEQAPSEDVVTEDSAETVTPGDPPDAQKAETKGDQ